MFLETWRSKEIAAHSSTIGCEHTIDSMSMLLLAFLRIKIVSLIMGKLKYQ